MSHWTGKTKCSFYEEIHEWTQDHKKKWALPIGSRITINSEKLKRVHLEMLCEAGVDTLLYTTAVAPIMNNSTIVGVIIESKSRREAIKAKIEIDASGDGDIAATAVVLFYKGRESNNKMQPATLMFNVVNVRRKNLFFL